MSDFYEEQIAYTPVLFGSVPHASVVVCAGMGGSGLPARALAPLLPHRRFVQHREYDLPADAPVDALYIATSHSGNTEETLSFLEEAHAVGRTVAVIASGGVLLGRAKELGAPYIEVPSGTQPRDSFLTLTKALLVMLGEDALLAECDAYPALQSEAVASAATLAAALTDRIPLIYAATHNEPLTYIAKITLNETAKVPAFSNVFPELNHNEMQGLDPLGGTAPLSAPLALVVIRDAADDARIVRRMDAFATLMAERKVFVHTLTLPEGTPMYTLLWLWLMVRAAAHQLAEHYGVPADEVPLVEAFKKML